MRQNNKRIEQFRVRHGLLMSDSSLGNNGAFFVPHNGDLLQVIASDGEGWDHVSVSLEGRCPTWNEMCYIKKLFFRGDEWVLQYHPPESENISFHDYCLHMWRPQDIEIPTPPAWMVGPKPKENPK